MGCATGTEGLTAEFSSAGGRWCGEGCGCQSAPIPIAAVGLLPHRGAHDGRLPAIEQRLQANGPTACPL